MKLPYGMRPSTLEERRRFYSHFDLKKARDWVGRKLVYAVVIGRHSGIYPSEYEDGKNEPLIIDSYKSLQDVLRWILKFLPEGVYYDRNYYKDFSLCHKYNLRKAWKWYNFAGQELAFDLDPENVVCPIHGSLEERMKKGYGLSFCEKAFELVKKVRLSFTIYSHRTILMYDQFFLGEDSICTYLTKILLRLHRKKERKLQKSMLRSQSTHG